MTWTKDANLFKTMYNADNTLISKIAAVTPTYNDPYWGLQTIDAGDFDADGTYEGTSGFGGTANWWGSLAFVNYLNHISYGGVNNWYLPTVANTVSGHNTPTNGTAKGDELPELFYQELEGVAYSSFPNTDAFDNEQNWYYWSGTEHASIPSSAWGFITNTPYVGVQDYGGKNAVHVYAWAVSPGQIAAVAEPESMAMLLLGLGVLGGVVRRRQTKTA